MLDPETIDEHPEYTVTHEASGGGTPLHGADALALFAGPSAAFIALGQRDEG